MSIKTKHGLRRKRVRPGGLESLLCVLVISTAATYRFADGFVLGGSFSDESVRQSHSHTHSHRFRGQGSAAKSWSALSATRDKKAETAASTGTNSSMPSWSRAADDKRSESRFGIRRRVRAVLAKAKDRTGVSNLNSAEEPSPGSIVAEAASLGAFEVDSAADLYYRRKKEQGRNGASDNTSKNLGNGTDATELVVRKPEEITTQVRLLDDDDADIGSGDDVDALLNTEQPLEPLPFTLPKLTSEQLQALRRGERVQEQSKMGREGSGYVVMDIKAPPYVVWECLLDFEAYPENIGTVRGMTLFTNTHLKSSYVAEKPVLPGTGRETRHYGTASITRARFILSKFRLNIAAIHRYLPHPDGHYMIFTLDKASKNAVFQDAKGIWFTQSNPDGQGDDVTRIWLLCELKVSSLLPTFIVDYAAKRAMPRATTWLKPLAEDMAERWMTKPVNGYSGKK